VLFTLYMITDPQTSPSRFRSQILFGAGIAVAYSVLLMLHVNFTMFYSVTAICAMRGLWLFAANLRAPDVAQPSIRIDHGVGYLRRLVTQRAPSPGLPRDAG
jgi:hypothetical protein